MDVPVDTIISSPSGSSLPFLPSMDQVEGDYRFKPGRGLAKFCRDHMCTRDLLYCLLQGRPLVVIGEPSQEKWAEFLSCVCATFTASKIGIKTFNKNEE